MDIPTEHLTALRTGLKKMVIQECNVRDVSVSQIGDDETVIGGVGALHLDSLDAVEIVTSLERCFGIKFESAGESRQIFKSFTDMARYVAQNAPPDRVDLFISSQTRSSDQKSLPRHDPAYATQRVAAAAGGGADLAKTAIETEGVGNI